MRQHVEVSAVLPGASPAETFGVLRELDRHVKVGGVIRSLRVEPADGDTRISHWDVKFRNGILRWSQRDEFDEAAQEMRFQIVKGDPEVLEGSWRGAETDDGCRITFECDFDLGIPSLSEFLDPVAVRLLRKSVRDQLSEIFGPTLVFDEAAPAAQAG